MARAAYETVSLDRLCEEALSVLDQCDARVGVGTLQMIESAGSYLELHESIIALNRSGEFNEATMVELDVVAARAWSQQRRLEIETGLERVATTHEPFTRILTAHDKRRLRHDYNQLSALRLKWRILTDMVKFRLRARTTK